MRRHITKLGLISSGLALAVVSGSTVFAMPPHASVHAQVSYGFNNNASNQAAAGQAHLAAAQLKACQNRETAINNIMSRIDTRAQNQLTLFSTIATRVENFYTSKGKSASNYAALTGAIDAAKTQAQADLSSLQGNSTFSCTANNPKETVTAFQSYLKTEITDLQNYRTAVKNLIVAVAQANGVNVADTSQTTTSQGGQQ